MDETQLPPEPPVNPRADSPMGADAVRLATLLRLLPLQRHEVLGHVSVLRLTATVLKRRIATDRFEPEAGLASVTSVHDHAGHIVDTLGLLRGFEPGSRADAVDPAQAVSQCLQVLRPLFNAGGHRVVFDPPSAGADSGTVCPPPVARHDLMTVVAAALLHALDGAGGPSELTIGVDGDRLAIDSAALPADQAGSGFRAPAPMIDTPGLRALTGALDLGLHCVPGRTVVRWGGEA